MIEALLSALAAFSEWCRGAGAAGPAAFVAVYATAGVLVLPVWPLTVAAGLVFGPWAGLAVAWPGSVLGAVLAFLTGRRFLRQRLTRRLSGSRRFAAVEAAVEAEGLKAAFLLRLSPVVPYNVLNYALSVTPLPGRHFLLATGAGAVPLLALQARLGAMVGGTAALAAGQVPSAGAAGTALAWVGLAATGLAVFLLARAARRALRRARPREPGSA